MNRYGLPEISKWFRVAEGCTHAEAHISIDGRDRWMNCVMIERLWKSLKSGCAQVREQETGSDLRRTLSWWFDFYNIRPAHKTFDGRKPMKIQLGGPRPGRSS